MRFVVPNLITSFHPKNHKSLFVILFGSLGIFTSNIILKKSLTNSEYYEYSLVITFLSLLSSFGAFGFEQVFLRLSKMINSRITLIDSKLLLFMIISICISTVLSSYYILKFTEVTINPIIVITLFVGISILMVIFNIYRFRSNFVCAQLINNLWKICLLVFSCAIYLFSLNIDYLLYIDSVIWCSIVFLLMYCLKNNFIKISSYLNTKKILSLSLNFFIALLTISFLSQGDRLLIENFFSKQVFTNYFYLCTLFLYPFSLFQNYIGFKELILIKNGQVNIERRIRLITFFTCILGIVILISSYFLSKINFLEINFARDKFLILMLIFIGCMKILYSYYSSIVGSIGTIGQLKKMNVFFLIVISLSATFFYYQVQSILTLVGLFTVLWASRLLIWSYFSKPAIAKYKRIHHG